MIQRRCFGSGCRPMTGAYTGRGSEKGLPSEQEELTKTTMRGSPAAQSADEGVRR